MGVHTLDDETIVVTEGDAPKIAFRLYQLNPDGTKGPYSLAGKTTSDIHFIVKDDTSKTDAQALFNYTTTAITIDADGAAPGALYSQVSVQFLSTDIVTPGFLYYRLKVSNQTVKKGLLQIEDV